MVQKSAWYLSTTFFFLIITEKGIRYHNLQMSETCCLQTKQIEDVQATLEFLSRKSFFDILQVGRDAGVMGVMGVMDRWVADGPDRQQILHHFT